ncbi:MAG: hypothetical protein GXO99_04930 [Nitrospirae bacterium]|nr:hypothetical protein [Nitrospirota bacterium]
MPLKVLISLVIVISFAVNAKGAERASPIKVLSYTPYVDVARKALQQIAYEIKSGSLGPDDKLIDALVPVIKSEPYLLKDALEVLYLVPDKLLSSRKDLYEALKEHTSEPGVIEFIKQKGGPWKKEILLKKALKGDSQEADQAVAALVQLDLQPEDLKRLIEGYLTRRPENYSYLLQYIRSHPEKIPSVKNDVLKSLYYILYDRRYCNEGVAMFRISGLDGIKLLFERFMDGKMAEECSYLSFQALRAEAIDLGEAISRRLKEEKDPIFRGKLLVLLIEAGRYKEARRYARGLPEAGAIELINGFFENPSMIKKAGLWTMLKEHQSLRVRAAIENLEKKLFCDELKDKVKNAIRVALKRLQSRDTTTVIAMLQWLNYCGSHPFEVKRLVLALATRAEDLRVKQAAMNILTNRNSYCEFVSEVKPYLEKGNLQSRVQLAGFIGLCRAWDEKSFSLAVRLLKKIDQYEKKVILQALTTSEVFPEEAMRYLEEMYNYTKDPNFRLLILGVYLKGLAHSEKGVEKLARLISEGSIDGYDYDALAIPQALREPFGRALNKHLRWWKVWMISAIDIPDEIKAESLIMTSFQSVDKPFEERLKRLEEAAKLSEKVTLRFRKQLLDFFMNNTEQWITCDVQTPTLNYMLGPEGKRILLEFYLKESLNNKISEVVNYYNRFVKRREPFYTSNTSGFVPLPADSETVEFYTSLLKKINRKDTYRFNIVIKAIRESLVSIDQDKRGVFRPLVPLLKRQIVDSMDQVYSNAALRELIGMITGKTPPPAASEKRYQEMLSEVPLEWVSQSVEEALRKAKKMPLPFKIDTTKEYLLPDGQRIVVVSFVLPQGYGLINPQEPFCIDYDKEYPEGVGMDEPSDRPYRWYIYRLLRKGYTEPVELEFYWSKDFGSIKGKEVFPDMSRKGYKYYIPEKAYKSYVVAKRHNPMMFTLRIVDRPEGLVFQSPFPVQEIDFMATALRPLDGSEGRDCKSKFLLKRSTFQSYRMSKEQIMDNLFVVLSSVDGYRFKAQ